MVNMTLAIPDEVHQNMKKFSEIRWSEVARKAIVERLKTLELAKKLAQSSKLTKKDIDNFDIFIKSQANKRFNSENRN